MTPNEIRQVLSRIQAALYDIEATLREQAKTNVGYQEVVHEVAEAWEGLERAVDKVNEIAIGLS